MFNALRQKVASYFAPKSTYMPVSVSKLLETPVVEKKQIVLPFPKTTVNIADETEQYISLLDVAASTLRSVKRSLFLYNKFLCNRQIEIDTLIRFKEWLKEEYSHNTIIKIMTHTTKFVKHLQTNDVINVRIVLPHKMTPIKKNAEFLANITVDDVIEKVIKNDSLPIYYRMLWSTGVRISELCNVKPKDVNDYSLYVFSEKTKKAHNPTVWFSFRKKLLEYAKRNIFSEKTIAGKGVAQIRRDIIKLNKEIFNIRFTPHDVRTVVLNLIKRETNNNMFVQLQAGHASIVTTQKSYFFANDAVLNEQIFKAANKWDFQTNE